MRRNLFLAAVAVVVFAGSVEAKFAAGAPAPPRSTAQRFAAAAVVVTGKVTAFEKETVDATSPFAGAKDKLTYKIAVVKIADNFAGANNLTHIKIGFVPPAKVDPNAKPPVGRPIRPGLPAPQLKEGQEVMLFLNKHPNADFYVMPFMSPPIELGSDAAKKEVELVKKFAAVVADPMKGLKSDKADVRAETAAFLLSKYRAYPEGAAMVEQVAIPADESKLILKGIAEGTWKETRSDGAPIAIQAFYQLGLTDKDGWKQPEFPRPKPGDPPVDFAAIQKEAFAKWLDGAGKDYVIKKIVPKQK